MNTTFKDLYNSFSDRIFGAFEILNQDIHPDIIKVLKVVRNKTLDGKMFTFKLSNGLDVYVIRELDSFIYADTLFVDNKRSVVLSIPYDLYNYEQKAIVTIVRQTYQYLCNQFVIKEGNTIYNKILSIAPLVLTFHNLRDICNDLEVSEFTRDDVFGHVTEEALYESLSYSINELLDYGGIFAIIDEKIKEEAVKNEDN